MTFFYSSVDLKWGPTHDLHKCMFIAGNDRSHQALNCHAADFKGKCHSSPFSRPQEKHGQNTSLESPRERNRDFVVA